MVDFRKVNWQFRPFRDRHHLIAEGPNSSNKQSSALRCKWLTQAFLLAIYTRRNNNCEDCETTFYFLFVLIILIDSTIPAIIPNAVKLVNVRYICVSDNEANAQIRTTGSRTTNKTYEGTPITQQGIGLDLL